MNDYVESSQKQMEKEKFKIFEAGFQAGSKYPGADDYFIRKLWEEIENKNDNAKS